MANTTKQQNSLIEFRKDPVSGDWVLISTKIQKKPVFFSHQKTRPLPKSKCPFENPQKSGGESALLWFPRPKKKQFKDWWIQVILNKYPVVINHSAYSPKLKNGLYEFVEGNGFQELVIMRDHERPFALMTKDEIGLALETYKIRYHALRTEPCVEYILIINNSGSSAGATVPHPHSQIFAIPIVPPDIARSMEGSRNYFRMHKACVHCDILKLEMKEKKRIVYRNKSFVVLAPYAPKVAYEVRIFPLRHEPRFEIMGGSEKNDLADAMWVVFSRLYTVLGNPDYNFFIHTSPPKYDGTDHYHWHIEILPRVAIWGGLELGAGIEVIKVAPEETARLLRKK